MSKTSEQKKKTGKGSSEKTSDNPNEKAGEKKESVKKELLGDFIYLVVACLLVFLILRFVGQRTQVNGDSMDPTLANGQSLIMDKISYRFRDPERFDIVIFPGPEEEIVQPGIIDRLLGRKTRSPYFIKRVIGLPGETVQIKDGKVFINGQELKEDVYGITDYIDEPGIAAQPLTLSEDEYFCLGDNRPVSFDSRYEQVGTIKKDEFTGKVWIRILPLSAFGKVD